MSDWECPKCKTEYDATGRHDEDSGEQTCDECGFRFSVQIEYEPSYDVNCVEHEWLPPVDRGGIRVETCKHCDAVKWKWLAENQ